MYNGAVYVYKTSAFIQKYNYHVVQQLYSYIYTQTMENRRSNKNLYTNYS